MSEEDKKKVKIKIEKSLKENTNENTSLKRKKTNGKELAGGKHGNKREEIKEKITLKIQEPIEEIKNEETKLENVDEKKSILTIEESINEKKKLPEELKKQIVKKAVRNLTICSFIMGLICVFHLGYINIARPEFIVDLKFFAFSTLIVAIILFEKAYKRSKVFEDSTKLVTEESQGASSRNKRGKVCEDPTKLVTDVEHKVASSRNKKDSGELCIHGIEALIFAILILFLPYIYFYSKPITQVIFVISPLYFGIYYAVKCMIIESKIKKAYFKSLSDVKEIIKKEKKV